MTLTFVRGSIKVMSTIALHSTGPPIEKMAYGESNGHVTDDFT